MTLDNWKSNNEQSLGELLLGFLNYYSNFEYELTIFKN